MLLFVRFEVLEVVKMSLLVFWIEHHVDLYTDEHTAINFSAAFLIDIYA
jgi:hypothetical protein